MSICSLIKYIKARSKNYFNLLLIIAILVTIDQGLKLVVEFFYEYNNESLMQIKDTIHIHPMVNYELPNQYIKLYQNTGIPTIFWQGTDVVGSLLRGCFFNLFFYLFYKFICYIKLNTYKRLIITIIALITATTLCGVLDRLFWDGTRDFICISQSYTSESGIIKIRHISADLKDLYLDLLTTLIVIYCILFFINYIKWSKYNKLNKSFWKLLKTEFKTLIGKNK